MTARAHHERRPKPAGMLLLAGLVMALLALANVMALGSWHASLFEHDDLAADSAALAHGHHHHHDRDETDRGLSADAESPDGTAPAIDLHSVGHAMIHGLAGLVPDATVVIPLHEAARDWYAGRHFVLSGISPQALLRPPRS